MNQETATNQQLFLDRHEWPFVSSFHCCKSANVEFILQETKKELTTTVKPVDLLLLAACSTQYQQTTKPFFLFSSIFLHFRKQNKFSLMFLPSSLLVVAFCYIQSTFLCHDDALNWFQLHARHRRQHLTDVFINCKTRRLFCCFSVARWAS